MLWNYGKHMLPIYLNLASCVTVTCQLILFLLVFLHLSMHVKKLNMYADTFWCLLQHEGYQNQSKQIMGQDILLVKQIAFSQQWGVQHLKGMPHSPTGQAIIECAHGTLKNMLQKQRRACVDILPQERVAKAC